MLKPIVNEGGQSLPRRQAASVDLWAQRGIKCLHSVIDFQDKGQRVTLTPTTRTPDVKAKKPRVVFRVANLQVQKYTDL